MQKESKATGIYETVTPHGTEKYPYPKAVAVFGLLGDSWIQLDGPFVLTKKIPYGLDTATVRTELNNYEEIILWRESSIHLICAQMNKLLDFSSHFVKLA